jgi:hypothetical protein
MTLVSQAEFARLCGVSRQAVLKWKAAGRLVLQGNSVHVEATDERMQRYHEGGSPLRRQSVDAVDTWLTNDRAVDKNGSDLSTERRLSDIDGTTEFDMSRDGLHRRVMGAANALGFDPRIAGDDIELWRNRQPHFVSAGDGFELNAYCALEMLRWWLNDDPIVRGGDDPLALLAHPFGTEATEKACSDHVAEVGLARDRRPDWTRDSP